MKELLSRPIGDILIGEVLFVIGAFYVLAILFAIGVWLVTK